jgi:hypothetical protein
MTNIKSRASIVALAIAVLLASANPAAFGRGHSHQHHHTDTPSSVARDEHGKIKRSEAAKVHFKQAHPCPATGKTYGSCPGYVIDHVTALKRGGADNPSNMQWQTTAAAKAKDKIE